MAKTIYLEIQPTPERSRIMQRVKSKDTKPEKVVRSIIHSLGYRFRLHYSKLPSKPDIVFPKRRKVIFVNGCFWHGHSCRAGQNRPKSNIDYWNSKISRTIARDKKNIQEIEEMGWSVLTIWECEIKDKEALTNSVVKFLDG